MLEESGARTLCSGFGLLSRRFYFKVDLAQLQRSGINFHNRAKARISPKFITPVSFQKEMIVRN